MEEPAETKGNFAATPLVTGVISCIGDFSGFGE
jgi:hypothetical protein